MQSKILFVCLFIGGILVSQTCESIFGSGAEVRRLEKQSRQREASHLLTLDSVRSERLLVVELKESLKQQTKTYESRFKYQDSIVNSYTHSEHLRAIDHFLRR